jgi:glucose-1-phosphate cytidylyltransferase
VKVVILAGGRGTRLTEETTVRPKPMVEIGGRPILWHIMKTYSHFGFSDFIVCLGYRGYVIKEYFANYFLHSADLTIDMQTNEIAYHGSRAEPWKVTLVDTGEETLTGGRLLRVRRYLEPDMPFLLTYGDGVADVDIAAQVQFHHDHGELATMTVVRPQARFGSSIVEGDRVIEFQEKPQSEGGFINGGFFVLSPGALDFIDGDDTPLETTPLQRLVAADQLRAWRHEGFWQPMDTLRERDLLEGLWQSGQAPWQVWAP